MHCNQDEQKHSSLTGQVFSKVINKNLLQNMTSTVASTHSSVSGGNKSSSSSVIIIRSESNVVTTHEDEDSNPFGHEDSDSSILRCHISSLSHHPHLSLTSHAVKKDVNLSSTSCVEVNKRMNGQHNPCNLLSTGHTSSSHSSQSNQGILRPSSASSLLHPVLDRYCESPSFLLDTSSSPTPHLSLSGHHSHHHLVGASDDDVDVDETSNDVSGRVSRMSSETPDPELMFSCSTLGSVDPRDVSVVTPSMMVDSVMGDDVGDSGIPTTSSILTHSSSSMKYTFNGHHREKVLLNGHHNHQTTLSSLNRTVVDELDGDEDVVGDLSLSIKQEKLEGDVNCILKHPPLNHLKPSPVSSSLVISSNPVSLGGMKSHSRTATIHSPLILSQLNSNTTRLPNGTLISHQNHQQPVSKAIPDSSTSSLAGITMTSASTTGGTTNGHQVSSTTGSQSKQVVISAAPSVVHHVLTTSSAEGVTPVVASTLPSTISLTTSTSSSAVASTPLDIKILPAGILQLASNLAAVFPSTATGTGNAVQKQQIAIQLLREDGTSIILPITTRGALAVSPITATTVTQGVQNTQANTTSVTTSVATGNTRLIQGMTAKSNTTVSVAGGSKGKSKSM